MAEGLEIRGVSKKFGPVPVLKEISLSAPPGRITALIGQNGAGKSTLFRIVMGLTPATSGRVTMDEADLLKLPLHRKAEAGLGYLAQECASFDELTVAENLTALLEILPLDKPERERRKDELLARTGLAKIQDRPFRMLSGGEKRRLEIAKILSTSPRLLLLDEPFSDLDPRIVEGIIDILKDLAAKGIGILLTDHNCHMTLEVAQYVYLLAEGEIVCEGAPAEIASDERARRLYFGDRFSYR
jgi:lipopolysaccharide export system ATP-binding protein